MLFPTAPTYFTTDSIYREPIIHNSALGTYTNFVNLLDLCGLALPAGFRKNGMPWGITFIS